MKRSSNGNPIKSSATSATPLQPSVLGSYTAITSELICPICLNLIEEAYMTKCGHTFCYACLVQSLELSNKCTKCNTVLKSKDEIFPNFLLNSLIQKQRIKMNKVLQNTQNFTSDSRIWEWQSYLTMEDGDLHVEDIDCMLRLLQQKRKQLVTESTAAHNQILLEFLYELRKQKQEALEKISAEISLVDSDISCVKKTLEADNKTLLDSVVPDHAESNIKIEQMVPKPQHAGEPSTSSVTENETFNNLNSKSKICESSFHQTLAKRRCHMHEKFDDLQECYFNTRISDVSPVEDRNVELLTDFSEKLKKFTQFSTVRSVATLSYAGDNLNNQSSIVSSIDFDKDCDHFAVAGVTKKIKVYDYESVINNMVDGANCPIIQMACTSKISCISWSHYHKSTLASSDYEGSVVIWDAFKGQKVRVLQEHEKRCWSVDFNTVNPRLLASGSDDAKVKLWSTGTQHSVNSIEAKANVCCVQFNPHSAFQLAFGCADHFVHYYDLRALKKPVAVFRGHKKAVSYAKFVDKDEIVSASTDSELKLWKTNAKSCIRSFRGHTNDKNFVGLATDGDFIACGSENNSLYIYYKGLSKSLLAYKFNVIKSVMDRQQNDDDGNEFVSAVAWRNNSNIVAAANSQGTVKILELI